MTHNQEVRESGAVARVRNHLAWRLMNLAYRVATDWYGSMMVGAVFYGLDKAARDSGYVGSPITLSDNYRRKVIASLSRDEEQIVMTSTEKQETHDQIIALTRKHHNVVAYAMHMGDQAREQLDDIAALTEERDALRARCERLRKAFRYVDNYRKHRDGEIKAFEWAFYQDIGIKPGDLDGASGE